MGPRRDEVLQTNELLEQILLRLNLRTLLTAAQLISRHWSTLISASPALQKALFFQPCTASEVSEPRFNPLLQEEFPYWLRSGTRTSRDHLNKSNLVRKPRDSPVTRPEASWRKMLPRQPPVTILGIWTQCHGMGGDHHAFSIGAESKLSSSRLHDSEPAGEDGSINPSPPLLQMRDLYDIEGSLDERHWGRRLTEDDGKRLRETATRADVVMRLCYTAQCAGERYDIAFLEKFMPSKSDAKEIWAASRDDSSE